MWYSAYSMARSKRLMLLAFQDSSAVPAKTIISAPVVCTSSVLYIHFGLGYIVAQVAEVKILKFFLLKGFIAQGMQLILCVKTIIQRMVVPKKVLG